MERSRIEIKEAPCLCVQDCVSGTMLRGEADTHRAVTSGGGPRPGCETFRRRDRRPEKVGGSSVASQAGASCEEVDAACRCEAGPCTLHSEAHTPTQDTLLCERCGKNRLVLSRYSEGDGTEEECVLSDPQGESDADADIEDTDSRLHRPSSLQRISSRRRKRPRVARQDTTESEDDGGRSHRSHRWNLRLSPDRPHSRTILEESISQVRPLVISGPKVEKHSRPAELDRRSKLWSLCPSSLSLSVTLLLLLPLSLIIIIISFLLPWTST